MVIYFLLKNEIEKEYFVFFLCFSLFVTSIGLDNKESFKICAKVWSASGDEMCGSGRIRTRDFVNAVGSGPARYPWSG